MTAAFICDAAFGRGHAYATVSPPRPLQGKVFPPGIHLLNQGDFPPSPAGFDLLFSQNRARWSLVNFVPDQSSYSVSVSESTSYPPPVLHYSADKVTGYACVEDTAGDICQDIDVEDASGSHDPALLARLKGVTNQKRYKSVAPAEGRFPQPTKQPHPPTHRSPFPRSPLPFPYGRHALRRRDAAGQPR